MLRTSSATLLSILALSLAAGTFACSGASEDNTDVESSKLAVQKNRDGKPTGDGTTCSWSGVTPVAPPPSTGAKPPGTGGGSSGGCNTDASGTYRCWSYDSNGQPTDIAPPSTSSGGSSGSSGGCGTDAQGNYRCWSFPSDPEPMPMPAPRPPPAPEPAPAPDAYKLGDWFPSIDGCNRCTCTDIGIMCTVQACDAPVPPPKKGCELNGRWFAAGEHFQSDCNSCSCDADGAVSCTSMSCPDPVPTSPPPAPPSPSR